MDEVGGPSERRDPLIGATLRARYRVLEKLAEGGMGAVYRAERTEDQSPVAIKVLHAHLAKDGDIVERFRREALAASAIGDAHIVFVHELDELDDGSGVFMAMELLEGQDLGALVRELGPLPVKRTVHIAAQIGRALEAAHDKGIVHRDLKPENVFLVERDGDPDFVKLLDFGVSKLVRPIEGVEKPSATKTGTTLGTPHYMAPEQAQAQKGVDHRVDVYALGVMLFRMLTGEHPFDDETYPMLVLKICTEPPPPVRTWRGDVPEALQRVIERMLAKDPGDRFQTAEAAAVALDAFAELDVAPVLLGGPSTRSSKARALSPGPRAKSFGNEAMAQTAPWTESDGTPPRNDAGADEDRESVAPPPGASNAPLKWAAGLFGLAVIAIVGWAVVGAMEDEPIDPEGALPELPEPRAASTQALVATGTGVGWTWVNPRPQAMPTWYSVDVASGGDPVVMVGRGGRAVRYEGGALFGWRTGTDATLRGVAWTGGREALAVGEGGAMIRLREREPLPLASGTDRTLWSVAAISPTEALVVGEGGTVLRVAGDRVTALAVETQEDLLSAFARGEQVFAVGAAGTVLRIEGRAVARETVPTDVTLRGVGGCPDGDVYAAGDAGTLLRRSPRGAWAQLRVTGTDAFTGVSCDHGRVAAIVRDGRILLVSGDRSIELPSGFDRPWFAVSGGRDGPSWIVGTGGRLATIEEDHVRTRTDGPTVPIRDLGAMGGALVAVGEWGRILRERERGLSQVESPTESGLAALIQIDEGRLIAVGDYGAMVDIRFDRATLVPTPTPVSLRDGVSAGEELLVVGVAGSVLRGTVGALAPSVVPEVGDLWGVAGTPADAIAVGDGGAVIHFGPTGHTRVRCEVAVTLRAVARHDGGTWAVGDDGVVVRLAEDGCVEEHRGGPALHAIGVGPEGRLIAAGDEGVVIGRTEIGDWAPVGVDVAGASIRTVWRSDRHVYLAGTGGALVRHVRVDGE